MTSIRYITKLEDGVWVIYKQYAIFGIRDWKGFNVRLKPTFMSKAKAQEYVKELYNT